ERYPVERIGSQRQDKLCRFRRRIRSRGYCARIVVQSLLATDEYENQSERPDNPRLIVSTIYGYTRRRKCRWKGQRRVPRLELPGVGAGRFRKNVRGRSV